MRARKSRCLSWWRAICLTFIVMLCGMWAAAQGSGCVNPVVVNPSFELPQITGSWQRFNAIPGWFGPIDVHRVPDLPASDGSQVVDLNQSSMGYIGQVISTVPGVQYRVDFDHGVNYHCTSRADLSVEVDGVSIGSFSSSATLAGDTVSFTATGATTLLTFRSLTGGCGAATIDNVRVACSFNDEDGDGLDDGVEDDLIASFAPEVHLDRREKFKPASVPWYLGRVQMRYSHDNCLDHDVLHQGDVNVDSLISQSHRATNDLCLHVGGARPSAYPPGSNFFLQIPNGGDQHRTRLGSDASDWTCYAHVYPLDDGRYDVQYWFFYAYNGKVRNVAGAHEGDWEHITVRVAADGTTVDELYLATHDGGTWLEPGCLRHTPDGRPVIFAALDSHASYTGPGSPPPHASGTGNADRTSENGDIFDCANATINVGELDAPLNGSQWIQYNGRWGEIGNDYVNRVSFSGPRTPTLQSSWFEGPGGSPTFCSSAP